MKSKKLATIVTILALLILVSGCSIGGIIKRATGGALDIDPKTGDMKIKTSDGDVEIGGGTKWDKKLTFGFAQPKGSKVESYYKIQSSVTYSLSALTRKEVDKFHQNLLDAGFEEDGYMESNGSLIYYMINKEEGQAVQVSYESDSNEGGIMFMQSDD